MSFNSNSNAGRSLSHSTSSRGHEASQVTASDIANEVQIQDISVPIPSSSQISEVDIVLPLPPPYVSANATDENAYYYIDGLDAEVECRNMRAASRDLATDVWEEDSPAACETGRREGGEYSRIPSRPGISQSIGHNEDQYKGCDGIRRMVRKIVHKFRMFGACLKRHSADQDGLTD